jgi:lysozyme
MKIDAAGVKLIENFEGIRLKAYQDWVGIWTIGCGMTRYPKTGKKVQSGETITQAECDSMFLELVKDFEEAVTEAIKVTLTQSQFNALVSLCYNIGTTGFSNSTLVKRINAKASSDLIRAAFLLWIKAGGKFSRTLTKRRNEEADLFLKA